MAFSVRVIIVTEWNKGGDGMPLEIIRNDITRMSVDAIVNAANESLLGGGGVDGAIHRAAGPKLLEECRALHGCRTGEAKITKGYGLPCRHVIHTVGPVWRGGAHGERELLSSCYRESLKLAQEYRCESVAFPLISAGAYGYPAEQALRVAMDEISGFLMEYEMQVYIVVFDPHSMLISGKLFANVVQYIDDKYVAAHTDLYAESGRVRRLRHEMGLYPGKRDPERSVCASAEAREISASPPASSPARKLLDAFGLRKKGKASEMKRRQEALPEAVYEEEMADAPPSLEDMLSHLDESFSQMLLRKIDERGMTDAQCYKRANISRKLFSKIRSDIQYKPSKRTAVAFAIALSLPLAETKELLEKAGFALTHSNKFDVIIEYFIVNGNYDIFEINEVLFSFDQVTLGG